MRRMVTKGPPPTYTEMCTHCQAVIPVRDVINIDAEQNRCPKCGAAYKVPGSEPLPHSGT
jgi:predicted nucleic acid-binding Zn ribbon protein